MHIRHGDSCSKDYLIGGGFQRTCTSTLEYAALARFLVSRYGLRSVYLSTDDENAPAEFKAAFQKGEQEKIPVQWATHDRSKYIFDGKTVQL